MPYSTTRLKKGTGINLPCLRLNITKVMSIIQNLTEAEKQGLSETGDPNDPYGVAEQEARKWPIPKDFFDALRDPLWKEWIKAIRKEMKGFTENEVYMRIPRHEVKPGCKVIKNLEVFSRKYKGGRLSRHKYRHVARGDMLPEGSVGNTYWCSASSTSLKLFCAIAVETGQQPEVIDVQTAYLEATEERA